MSEIGNRFDLGNADVIHFLRNYDFAWARRQLVFNVEAVRAILLSAESEGWSLVRISREIQAVTLLDGALAELLARTETIRAANLASVASYSKAGIDRVVWLADSDSCQYCRNLNGKTTPISKPFLEPGPFQARKNGWPLLVREPVFASPLHWGCRCTVRADV